MTTVALDFDAIPPPSPPTEGVVQHDCLFVSVHMPPNPMGQYSIDRYTGSVSFSNSNWFGVTRLTRDAGGRFALVSIDLDAFNPLSTVVPGGPTDASEPQTVTFTGTRVDGSSTTSSSPRGAMTPGEGRDDHHGP